MISLMFVLADLCDVCYAHVADLADIAEVMIPVICVQQSSKQPARPELASNLHDTSRCNRNRSAIDSSSICLYC